MRVMSADRKKSEGDNKHEAEKSPSVDGPQSPPSAMAEDEDYSRVFGKG